MKMPLLAIITLLTTTFALPAQGQTLDHPTITELAWMGTTTSANDEWLELYNPTVTDVDLTGWTLSADDGSPAIVLSGTLAAGGYFLLERTDDDTVVGIAADQFYTGSLSNTGETLRLTDANGTLVDALEASTGWPGGDNTTKQTLERRSDGSWTTSLVADGTPKATNSQWETGESEDDTPPPPPSGEEEDPAATPAPGASSTAKKNEIVFYELFPNPIGTDEFEFIELKNVSAKTIDITGFQIITSGGQTFTLPSLILSPGVLVNFARASTDLVLRNATEQLSLKTPGGQTVTTARYTDAPEGKSYSQDAQGDWQWVEHSTPGIENLIPLPLPRPVLEFFAPTSSTLGVPVSFDASDSFSPDRLPISFTWDFGNGFYSYLVNPTVTYERPGRYTIRVDAVTDTASSTRAVTIEIVDAAARTASTTLVTSPELPAPTETPRTEEFMTVPPPRITITEVLPNPTGTDDAEFIELHNAEDFAVDLEGWQVDDGQNGSRAYVLPALTRIEPEGFLVLTKKQTGLALNNDADSARLMLPDGTVHDQFSYDSVAEGQSWAKQENEWVLSEVPTPGAMDKIRENEIEAATTTPTTTSPLAQVLGAATEEQPPAANGIPLRALAAGLSAVVLFGIGAIVKLRG